MNDSWIWAILLQLIMLGLNAYFACAEIAVISVNENHINKLIEEGDKRAVKLKKISEVPTKFLSTIQIAITLSGFLGSAYATDNFAASLTGLFAAVGLTLPRSIACPSGWPRPRVNRSPSQWRTPCRLSQKSSPPLSGS